MELAERKCYSPKAGGSTRTTGQMLVKTGIVSLAARTQPKPPPDVRVRAAAAFMNMWETFKWECGFPTITAEQRAMREEHSGRARRPFPPKPPAQDPRPRLAQDFGTRLAQDLPSLVPPKAALSRPRIFFSTI